MFESEDMLPRPPPMPSAPVNAAAIQPTVPEVSIIFGKQTPTPNEANENQQTSQTYAAWKQKNLPHVSFPPNLNDEQIPSTPGSSSNLMTMRSNVFPMRTVVVPTNASTGICTTTSSATNTVPEKTFRNEPDLQIQAMPSLLSQFNYRSVHRRSMDSLSQKNEPTLTICAGTQTETIKEPESTEFLKKEFNHLIDIINDLQREQRKIREIMETFVVQQQKKPTHVFYCDQATQYEVEFPNSMGDTRTASSENVQAYNQNGTLHYALPNVKIYSPLTRDTIRPAAPIAQSNAPCMSSPLNNQNGILITQTNNQYRMSAPSLPKPTTERSMVMNELALKYLPSEKLTELLQDAQISTPNASGKRLTPLRETDNFNRAPTDISNASYKYLRKYRLLPGQNAISPTQNELQSSPYQQRSQDSPKACVTASPGTETESPHIDLEHIRRQPKFL